MKVALCGSQGLSEHVLDALHEEGSHELACVVDHDGRRVGMRVKGHTVEPVDTLHRIAFDTIIIADMNYGEAVDCLSKEGWSYGDFFDGVFWEPFFLQVEPTTKCNFSCTSCSRRTLPAPRRDRCLSLSEFEGILKGASSVKRIQLQGLGEPSLNPDLLDMLTLCKEKKINTSITTNASFLERDVDAGILSRLDKLIVSVNPEEGRGPLNRRRSTGLSAIGRNILHALQNREEGRPRIVYNFVLDGQNQNDLEDIVRFTESTRPDELHLHLVENWYVPGEEGFEGMRAYIAKAHAGEGIIIEQVAEYRKKLAGIALTYTGAQKRKGRCWWPFFGAFVTCDGFVTACCIRMHPESSGFGNVFTQGLRDVWFGRMYDGFRRAMFDESLDSVCSRCPC